MSIKRKDTPENREFWRFVEDTARRVHHESPGWTRCIKCGNVLDDHVTRWACVLKPGVVPCEDWDV